MSMKKLLALVALGAVVASPAFAQSAPRAHRDAAPSYEYQGSARVHPYAADHYQRPGLEYNNNVNPDFQLGGGER
jgi:hypothetical protein